MTLSNIINMQKVNPFLLFFMVKSIHLSSLLDGFYLGLLTTVLKELI